MMQSTRKQRRFGCLSSLCSPISYQNRNKSRISIHGYMHNHHSRLSRVCIPVFRILYLPRLLSPLYVTSLPVLILKPRCQRSRFILIATHTLALATVTTQNSPQRTPPIPRHPHHPNAHLPVFLLLALLGLPSPLPFSQGGPRVPAWSLV